MEKSVFLWAIAVMFFAVACTGEDDWVDPTGWVTKYI
jgi:hypothetical protein